jgi:hypothetical protein
VWERELDEQENTLLAREQSVVEAERALGRARMECDAIHDQAGATQQHLAVSWRQCLRLFLPALAPSLAPWMATLGEASQLLLEVGRSWDALVFTGALGSAGQRIEMSQ